MDADLDTFVTALYVTIDDTLRPASELSPVAPRSGLVPKLSDAELLTLAVLQALLASLSERGSCATPRCTCAPRFPYIPHQSATTSACAAQPVQSRDRGCCRSTPTCGTTTPGHGLDTGRGDALTTALRSSTWRGGLLWLLRQPLALVLRLRLHLVCTPAGLPVTFALAIRRSTSARWPGPLRGRAVSCCAPAAVLADKATSLRSSSTSWRSRVEIIRPAWPRAHRVTSPLLNPCASSSIVNATFPLTSPRQQTPWCDPSAPALSPHPHLTHPIPLISHLIMLPLE